MLLHQIQCLISINVSDNRDDGVVWHHVLPMERTQAFRCYFGQIANLVAERLLVENTFGFVESTVEYVHRHLSGITHGRFEICFGYFSRLVQFCLLELWILQHLGNEGKVDGQVFAEHIGIPEHPEIAHAEIARSAEVLLVFSRSSPVWASSLRSVEASFWVATPLAGGDTDVAAISAGTCSNPAGLDVSSLFAASGCLGSYQPTVRFDLVKY